MVVRTSNLIYLLPSIYLQERSIFWKVIVLLITSKKKHMHVCPIPNGVRDRTISLYITLCTVQTSNTSCTHTSCKVYWCCRWKFRKCIILGKLYQPSETVRNISFLSTILEVYSAITLSRKQFGIGYIYIYIYIYTYIHFLLRMADTMVSQNICLSFWDTLYIYICNHQDNYI
jgi:hypothetical protein